MRPALAAALALLAFPPEASAGLVIHSQEFGVGKFHRIENRLRPFGPGHAWLPYVLPAEAVALEGPLARDNADGSVSVAFSTLEELLGAVEAIAGARGEKVTTLNVHGHGTPGGMWFPKDAKTLDSIVCLGWRRMASGSDEANRDQYYALPTAQGVLAAREASRAEDPPGFSCVTGLKEWQDVVSRHPGFKASLERGARLRLVACVAGLGRAGERLVRGLGELLFGAAPGARVEAPVSYGMGDASIDDGMAFWDYVDDEQMARDQAAYASGRRDREIVRPGSVRVGRAGSDGTWVSETRSGLDRMELGEVSPATSGGPIRSSRRAR